MSDNYICSKILDDYMDSFIIPDTRERILINYRNDDGLSYCGGNFYLKKNEVALSHYLLSHRENIAMTALIQAGIPNNIAAACAHLGACTCEGLTEDQALSPANRAELGILTLKDGSDWIVHFDEAIADEIDEQRVADLYFAAQLVNEHALVIHFADLAQFTLHSPRPNEDVGDSDEKWSVQ